MVFLVSPVVGGTTITARHAILRFELTVVSRVYFGAKDNNPTAHFRITPTLLQPSACLRTIAGSKDHRTGALTFVSNL
jgi:hypothetical protein